MFAFTDVTDKTPPVVTQDELFGEQLYILLQIFPNPLHMHLQDEILFL